MSFDTKGKTGKEIIEQLDEYIDDYNLPFAEEGGDIEKDPFENIDSSKVKDAKGRKIYDKVDLPNQAV